MYQSSELENMSTDSTSSLKKFLLNEDSKKRIELTKIERKIKEDSLKIKVKNSPETTKVLSSVVY
jgi:hypothetical protein